MAQFTRRAAEQFRPEEAAVGWLWNIFVFSLVVFGSIMLLYFGMEFGYGKYLQNEIETTQAEIDKLKGEISPEDQKLLSNFYSQVFNASRLLSEQTTFSKFFSFFEGNTNVSVYFKKVSYSRSGNANAISFDGVTNSFESVASQVEALRRRPEVEEVVLNSASKINSNESKSVKEEVRFSLRVVFNDAFLLNK